tara:strand:- start:680 stop:946 length:267 start_codon:yes stop_codon:yes gene_type:complete
MAEATEMQEEPAVLNFNGAQYPLDSLSEPQKYLIAQIQDLDVQIKQVQARLHQAEVSKKGFVELLEAALAVPEETPPAEEDETLVTGA